LVTTVVTTEIGIFSCKVLDSWARVSRLGIHGNRLF
jgi:hypothetical protein